MVGKQRPTGCVYCQDKEDRIGANWCCYKDKKNIFEINEFNCPCGDIIEEFEIFDDDDNYEQPQLF